MFLICSGNFTYSEKIPKEIIVMICSVLCGSVLYFASETFLSHF